MSDRPRPGERALLVLACVYCACAFGGQQLGFFDPNLVEWDARGMLLAVFRYHDTGLLPHDLGAARAEAMAPLGWRAVMWLGTLALDPVLMTRLLAAVLFLVLLWQGYQIGARAAGPVTGAGVALLLCKVPFFWDRILGANPRAFGLVLGVTFLRYATEERAVATMATLVGCAAFYPSTLLVCAPAYAAHVSLRAIRDRAPRPLVTLGACGVLCLALVLPPVLTVDPRVGRPITVAELASLRQSMTSALYPLPRPSSDFARPFRLLLADGVGSLRLSDARAAWPRGALALLVLFAVALGLRRYRPHAIHGWALLSAGLGYWVSRALAYRLYIPDRALTYTWTPIFVVLLPVLTTVALRPFAPRRAPVLAVLGLFLAHLLANGLGLPRLHAMRNWRAGNTAAVQFVATLPRQSVIAAGVDESSYVAFFARRGTRFAGISNSPNFGAFARETERRIAAFYDAYYAQGLDEVRAFARREQVDYLLVDELDYGPDAQKRARYVRPWTEYAQALVRRGGPFALSQAPPEAIVFRAGTVIVLDLGRL